MKRHPVNCNLAHIPQKVLFVRGVGQCESRVDVGRPIIRLSPTSHVNRAKGIPAGDFPRNIKVAFPVPLCAFVDGLAPFREIVGRDLSCLVDAKGIDVEHGDDEAGKVFNLVTDGGVPFAQAILDGSEFGELALPIGKDSKGFSVAVMVKFTKIKSGYQRMTNLS
jgi:hypothetical protein